MKRRVFEFRPLLRPKTGAGYGKLLSYELREHGRSVFIDATQEYHEDLPMDPWGFGNPEDPEEWTP